jgi:hypothetical protein
MEVIMGQIVAGSLSPEAREILYHAAKTTGRAHFTSHLNGSDIAAGNSHHVAFGPNDQRRETVYKDALRELVSNGLLEQHTGTLYKVTTAGYVAADGMSAP